ncbi:MAG TPA: hypothetical protein VI282_04950, partial [Verrucomicrobiae bacterium]
MKQKGGNRFWKWSRRLFRWFRILVLFAILIGAVALLYLNRVGLPKFVKTRVVAALEAEGLDVKFTRLRLSGYRHIVIDDMGVMGTNGAPFQFSAKQAELKFDREALRSLNFKLESLLLKNGILTIDLTQTNGPPQVFVVNKISADLRAKTGDRWILQTFEGEALGAKWNVSGSLTNLISIAQKSTPQAKPTDWTPVLRDVVNTFDKIHFGSPPQVTVTALGDFKDLALFRASVALRGTSARTPWGELEEVVLRSSIGPGLKAGDQMEVMLNLSIKSAAAEWGTLQRATVAARAEYPLTNSVTFESLWTIRGDEVATRWYSGRKIDVSLDTRQAGTNLVTLVQASAENGKSLFGAAGRTAFQARLEHAYPIAALNKALFDFLPVQT